MVDNWLASPCPWKSYIFLTLGKIPSLVWTFILVKSCIISSRSSVTFLVGCCVEIGLIFWWYLSSLVASLIAMIVLGLNSFSLISILCYKNTDLFLLNETHQFLHQFAQHCDYIFKIMDMHLLYFSSEGQRRVMHVVGIAVWWSFFNSLGLSATHWWLCRAERVKNKLLICTAPYVVENKDQF